MEMHWVAAEHFFYDLNSWPTEIQFTTGGQESFYKVNQHMHMTHAPNNVESSLF